MMTTSPRLLIMMFCGFRSRWMTPRSCAAASPAQSLRAVSRALSDGQAADAREQRGEIFAVHVLHGDEGHAFDLADIVNAADVGMGDQAGDADLAVEALEQARIARRLLGQELERDGLAEREVGGAIDLAHAAAAQQADDAIAAAEQRAGNEAALHRRTDEEVSCEMSDARARLPAIAGSATVSRKEGVGSRSIGYDSSVGGTWNSPARRGKRETLIPSC